MSERIFEVRKVLKRMEWNVCQVINKVAIAVGKINLEAKEIEMYNEWWLNE